MKVISIGTDRKIFEDGSAVRQRSIEYGKLFDELHMVIFTTGSKLDDQKIAENVFIYPTNSSNRIASIFDSFKIAKKIILSSKLQAPSFIISTQDPFETGIVGLFLKLFYGLPLQIQLHTDFNNKYFLFSSFLNFIRFFLAHLTLPFADEARTVSLRSKRGIGELNENIVVLPIYTEVESRKSKVESRKNTDKVSILTVARLEKEKDIETGIIAFAKITKENRNVKFVIVGEGRERKSLEKLAEKLGIKEKVIFVGWRENLKEFYENADIYISTSLFEGYGMSVIEAANYKIPLVLSRAGVAEEIFENNKSALVCDPKNIEQFTGALEILINDDNLRRQMGNEAKDALVNHLISKEKYLSSYKESMESALNQYKSRGFWGRVTNLFNSTLKGNRVLRFVIAGITAAGTQIITLYIFTDLLGVWYLASSMLSYIIALSISFLLQKLWAFRSKELKGVHVQFIKYILLALAGIIINTVSMYLLVDVAHIWYIFAQIIVNVFIAIMNFFVYRKFIFK